MSAFADWIDSLDLEWKPIPEGLELEQGMVLRSSNGEQYDLVGNVNVSLDVYDDLSNYDGFAFLPFRKHEDGPVVDMYPDEYADGGF
jgi:hypothetical protein